MTKKRFTVPKNYRCIQDNLTKKHYICEDKTEAINLADLLNALHEENQQIKSTIKEAYRNERTHIGESVLRQLINQIWSE